MNVNEIFSTSRFAMLFKKNVVESWKKSLLTICSLFGVYTLLLIWMGYTNYSPDPVPYSGLGMQDNVHGFISFFFVFEFFVMGASIASKVMTSHMKNKTGRIRTLMTPASAFEKYIFNWFVIVVLFNLINFGMFYVCDFVRVFFFTTLYPNNPNILPFDFWGFVFDQPDWSVVFAVYFVVQSMWIVGGAIWEKRAFVMTAISMLVIFAFYALISWVCAKALIAPDSNISSRTTGISPEQLKQMVVTFLSVLTVFNWTIAYYRTKEAEVINRI